MEELKNEFDLQVQLHFIYNQLIYSIQKSWKDALMGIQENIKNLVFQGHHLLKNHQIHCLNKLNGKDIYSILVEFGDSKPSSQSYYKKAFQNSNLDSKTIYVLPRISTKKFKTSSISIQNLKLIDLSASSVKS